MTGPCRIYAPVGSHEDLLPYLVRRLLENGANTSFVNRIVDDRQPIDEIIADPVARLAQLPVKPHPRIPLPRDLYGPERKNAAGLDLNDPTILTALREGLAAALRRPWGAAPIIAGIEQTGAAEPVFDPSDRRRRVGEVVMPPVRRMSIGHWRGRYAAPRCGTAPRQASGPRCSKPRPISTRGI